MAQENRTEKATPYQRKKLREEGNVAKSTEISLALTVLLSSLALFYAGYGIFKKTVSLLTYATQHVPKLLLQRINPKNSLKVLVPLGIVYPSIKGDFGKIGSIWDAVQPQRKRQGAGGTRQSYMRRDRYARAI